MDISRVKVADQKPLLVKEGSGAGKLFDAPQVPAAVFCARQGLDLLIGGTIREVEGYILLDAWAYDALRAEMVFTSRDANLREEIYASLPGFGRQLSGLFLGRPWASIAFAPDPPDSSLFIDDKLVATGKTPSCISLRGPGQSGSPRPATVTSLKRCPSPRSSRHRWT